MSLSRTWFNTSQNFARFCWNPIGKIDDKNYIGEIGRRFILRRPGPIFEQPKYSFAVEVDPSLAKEGPINFPEDISMTATDKILESVAHSKIQQRQERVSISADSMMILAGYKKGEWELQLKMVSPSIVIDGYFHEPMQPLQLEFVKATSTWKEDRFTKSYKINSAQLNDKDICVLSDALVYDTHNQNPLDFFVVEDKKEILEPHWSGGHNPLLMKQFFMGNFNNIYTVTLKDGRYMDFETFTFPEEIIEYAETHMVILQENMEQIHDLRDGLWILKGRNTHITEIDLAIDYEPQKNKKVYKQHVWNKRETRDVMRVAVEYDTKVGGGSGLK